MGAERKAAKAAGEQGKLANTELQREFRFRPVVIQSTLPTSCSATRHTVR